MFIQKRSRIEYVCSDGHSFNSEKDAENHEYKLIRNNIYNNQTKEIGNYMLYVIYNNEELEALKRNDYGISKFNLPKYISYPLILAEESFEEGYYKVYQSVDMVIEKITGIITELIGFLDNVNKAERE